MNRDPIAVFLSCSFKDEDRDVVSFFMSVCNGLQLSCANVSDGSPKHPPEMARDLIDSCDLFVAIATRREKLSPDRYIMPPSVHDEISIAYALKKPVLLFREDKVAFEGFLNSYGTHLTFDRERLHSPEFLAHAISSVASLKGEHIAHRDLPPGEDAAGFVNEYMHGLNELVAEASGYTWVYSLNRMMRFTREYSLPIRNATWANLPSEQLPPDHKIEWKINVESGSRPFELKTVVEKDTPTCIETLSTIVPTPRKGDFLELSHRYQSPYLNRIQKNQTDARYTLGAHTVDCFDGVVPVYDTNELAIQLKFPTSYGINKGDIFHFVGSWSSGIDYLVEAETKRVRSSVRRLGGHLIADIFVTNPLLRHFYGIAWTIPKMPSQ